MDNGQGQRITGSVPVNNGGLEQIVNNSRIIVMRWRMGADFPVEFVSGGIRRLGYTPEDLISGRVVWTKITHPEDADRLRKELEAYFAEGLDEFDQHYRLRKADGSDCWIEDHNQVVRDASGRITHIDGLLFDVTDRISVEAALRESEANFHALADNAHEAIFVEDRDGRQLYANRYAVRLTGFSRPELLLMRLADLVVPHDRDYVTELTERHLAGEALEESYEAVIRRKDGGEVPVEVSVGRTTWKGQPATIGLLRDITERRRLEREVVETARQEQERIGQDFHDTLGQQLTAISFLSKAMQYAAAKVSDELAAEATHIAALAQNAVNDARRIARGLAPINLVAGGLRSALEELAETVSRIWQTNCFVVAKKEVPVRDASVSAQLYWIAQEAVNNAVRHAHAGEIVVHLAARGEWGVLRVRDDGVGIDADAQSGSGMGLRIMRYRASLIGARLRVTGQPGKGTEIVCRFSNGEY